MGRTGLDTVSRLAVRAGLCPAMRIKPYRGAREMFLNGPGREGAFGAVEVGARTGRVLRAVVTVGWDGPTVRATGYLQVRALLRRLADGQPIPVGPSPTDRTRGHR